MPYELNWKDNGCIIILTGNSSIEEINKSNGEIQGDYRFDTHKYQIWNHLDADLSAIISDEASIPASIDSIAAKYVPGIKVALVIQEKNAVNFANYYIEKSKEFGSTWEVKLFDNMENTVQWVYV